MATKYSSKSVYYNTPISSDNKLGILVPRTIPASVSDKLITINQTYHLKPGLLAYDLYGSAELWFVFTARNPNVLASDPLGNFVSGIQIYVPDATALKKSLGI